MGRAARIAKIFRSNGPHHALSDDRSIDTINRATIDCVASERLHAASFCSSTLGQYGPSRLRARKMIEEYRRGTCVRRHRGKRTRGEKMIFVPACYIRAPSPIKSSPTMSSTPSGAADFRVVPVFGNGITLLFWLRILLRFAGFCRRKLLILFVVSVAKGTHNLLVSGSNPGGPPVESITSGDLGGNDGCTWPWLRRAACRGGSQTLHFRKLWI